LFSYQQIGGDTQPGMQPADHLQRQIEKDFAANMAKLSHTLNNLQN
jgi:hypothetical protein